MIESLQEAILIALYEYYDSHQGNPKMLLTGLCKELFGVPSRLQANKVQGEMFILRKKGWADYELTDTGKTGYVWIEPDGITVAQTLQQTTMSEPTYLLDDSSNEAMKQISEQAEKVVIPYKNTSQSCPANLEELSQIDQLCAQHIQRDALVLQIEEYFTRQEFVVLHGQPMVGKTRFLSRLSEALDARYIPLIVTGQGFRALSSLDAFVFDLADQLTTKFNKWANSNQLRVKLDNPEWREFNKGSGQRSFEKHWKNLQREAINRNAVIMFDEIERLLDYPTMLDPQILYFLDDFIRNPENGHFILTGSERIHFSNIEEFNRLIAKGQSIRVGHYDEKTISVILTSTQKFFAFDKNARQYFIKACDGHPRVLNIMFEIIFSLIRQAPGKQHIGENDIETIIANAIDRTSNFMWMLRDRLSKNERVVVWLISKKVSDLVAGKPECSLDDLITLADQHLVDYANPIHPESLMRGISDLIEREWAQWKDWDNRVFQVKLGIFLLWLQRRYITFEEVMGDEMVI